MNINFKIILDRLTMLNDSTYLMDEMNASFDLRAFPVK